ncbi:uncharacterized protein EI97DRAFT_277945 [Westerdykella ornata]|uniref:N-acetyltransferase domain-containing protein n=1 Tax=Westerdykella ornata TaxID=318751 RepID=A0A6A6JN08_WESOR|nr:uncharacterized protein EI97DRAFT_277945 [Westerdykella ornata]KAF2277907.1 hypothetical protein EI97DRAFT_277945 [Westerdykella ornata]
MSSPNDILITPVTNPETDLPGVFNCIAQSFGAQIQETLWLAVNPSYDTPQGRQRGIHHLQHRYEHVTRNRDGDPNTVFIKATVRAEPGDENSPGGLDADGRKIVGMAIWQQASFVEGYGDVPSTVYPEEDLEDLDPREARFARQMFASMWRRRVEVAREKAEAAVEGDDGGVPAIFVLDMCAVDPGYQRRGIAKGLVRWGLEEARRRGGLECTTEATVMGLGVYKREGFREEEGNDGALVYEVDEEFRDRRLLPVVFLRTGGGS